MVYCSGLENPGGKSAETAEITENSGSEVARDATFVPRSAKRDGTKVGTPGPRVSEAGFCYFWGIPNRRIKIGATSNPSLRLRTLRYQFRLPCVGFLAVVPGGSRVEAEYHARFAEHRTHGEWFAPHPDILAEIARLACAGEAA